MAVAYLQELPSCPCGISYGLSTMPQIIAPTAPNVGQLQTGRQVDCSSAALMLFCCHSTGIPMLIAWRIFEGSVPFTPPSALFDFVKKC